ncbi:MAG: 50S ribosomal protein L13 [Methanosarcinaceae archaeon]|nr:50S ribosomal protein L13 [Methanosarcinaceae archaeon]MDF1534386.1 50S ribosomal protein L13 [Methanosarcinaceae archaeon]MDO9517174.1 50S ribosomal protein L13 [Methanosarcinaceae archaeon]
MTVIDADGLIMGRLASMVAKRLLAGEEIGIVNAEKAVISGTKVTTFEEYKVTRVRGTREFGPYFPKRPDRILKRTVRGMLPYKRLRGKEAMDRLKIYVGVPSEFKDAELITVESANMNRLSSIKYVRLGELSTYLGAKF